MIPNQQLSELIKRALTGALLVISFGGAYLHSSFLFICALLVLYVITMCYEWPRLVDLHRPSRMLFSLLYPTLPFATLMWLTHRYYHIDFYLPLLPFLIAWGADTSGYIIGKLMGRHKMCPTISPGKSWEGFGGSFAATLALCWFILPRIILFSHAAFATNKVLLTVFALAMTTVSFLGGFFLSLLKRKEGLKDAGTLLPGHGGVLDRFDGVLFVGLAILLLTLW